MILFDLSRLVSRAGRETPTGIDRVELAYAEHLVASRAPLSFTMMTLLGGFGMLPETVAKEYLQVLAGAWREAGSSQRIAQTKRLARTLHTAALWRGERALRGQCSADTGRVVYVLVSHHHLEKRRAIARLKRQVQACFVCLIHDLIPIEFPEYALPGQNDKHRRRIETAAALADAVIVNSAVTREGFAPYLARAGRAPPIVVAPFGVGSPAASQAEAPPVEPPYFVCVGTIEARKNHLLLLNLWRQLVDELGGAAPRLVLIGQRGWETENAIDMLERCPALRGVVFERANVPDDEAARLVRGAQALLLPSFAEGFGFPMVEALALGVPVLCSNLPALRENGGDVPEYLDPLDGLGWRSAVIDYALPASPRRAAQLRRLSGWKAPSWQDHFAAVEALIAEARLIGQYETDTPPVPRLGARREARLNTRQTADMR
ncbi:MAG: glycosyltransferase family 4 protein [Acetobacteraceae bacterium]|nr:glycosyltransferase family 4 protein [Acetobacteraceae bacterium]